MSYKWVFLSIGTLLGNLEGVRLPGFLSISGVLSWTQRTLRFYVWGAIWNLVKEQGPTELISDYRAQRACL